MVAAQGGEIEVLTWTGLVTQEFRLTAECEEGFGEEEAAQCRVAVFSLAVVGSCNFACYDLVGSRG